MEVAELFVKLGVRGADQAKKAVGGVKQGLVDVGNTSLTAKAAVIGVVYALERMTAAAGQHGSDLANFTRLTGASSQELQKWQIAATGVGIASEEMTASAQGVLGVMAQMQAGGAPPAGWEMFKQAVDFDPSRANDLFYFMDKLREFGKLTAAQPALGNKLMNSFGLTQGFIAASRNAKFDPSKTPLGLLLQPGTLSGLEAVTAQWATFWAQLSNTRDQNVSAFGPGVIKELSQALKLFRSLEKSVEGLVKTFPELGTIGKAALLPILGLLIWAGGPITALSAAVTGLIFLMGEWEKHKENDKNSLFGDSKTGFWDKLEKNVNEPNKNLGGKSIGDEMFDGKAEQALFRWLEKPNLSNIQFAHPPQHKVVNNTTHVHAQFDSAEEVRRLVDDRNDKQAETTFFAAPFALQK